MKVQFDSEKGIERTLGVSLTTVLGSYQHYAKIEASESKATITTTDDETAIVCYHADKDRIMSNPFITKLEIRSVDSGNRRCLQVVEHWSDGSECVDTEHIAHYAAMQRATEKALACNVTVTEDGEIVFNPKYGA